MYKILFNVILSYCQYIRCYCQKLHYRNVAILHVKYHNFYFSGTIRYILYMVKYTVTRMDVCYSIKNLPKKVRHTPVMV